MCESADGPAPLFYPPPLFRFGYPQRNFFFFFFSQGGDMRKRMRHDLKRDSSTSSLLSFSLSINPVEWPPIHTPFSSFLSESNLLTAAARFFSCFGKWTYNIYSRYILCCHYFKAHRFFAITCSCTRILAGDHARGIEREGGACWQ